MRESVTGPPPKIHDARDILSAIAAAPTTTGPAIDGLRRQLRIQKRYDAPIACL